MGTTTRRYDFFTTIETPTQPTGAAAAAVSNVYNTVWSAETSKSVDTSAEGIDATKAVIQFCDTSANDYERLNPKITTPDADTVLIETAIALTGTYQVIVIGAE